MTLMTKTMRADQLPGAWQKELRLDADKLVRVAIEEVEHDSSDLDAADMLADLHAIVPVKVADDVTSFIRAERDRLDGRNRTP